MLKFSKEGGQLLVILGRMLEEGEEPPYTWKEILDFANDSGGFYFNWVTNHNELEAAIKDLVSKKIITVRYSKWGREIFPGNVIYGGLDYTPEGIVIPEGGREIMPGDVIYGVP